MTGSAATAYDLVTYPTGLFSDTHPDHLATIAAIHGLSPADPRTARVLEIGGGDGMNMTAFAVAYPDAHVTSFDLAPSPVARGRAVIAALGLDNIALRVGDILEEAERLDGPFDYVIAHGVYAWVPEPVRQGIMRLVGRVLAPGGIAFLSYNATPGGHLRQALREMALHAAAGITGQAEQLEAGWTALAEFAQGEGGEHPALAGLRHEAEAICRKRPEVLHHDELGEVYAPQSLTDVVAAAAANGLSYLNDSQPTLIDGGFARGSDADEIDEAALVRTAQMRDYRELRFFRQSLFVRAGSRIDRRSIKGVQRLWLSSVGQRIGRFEFELDRGRFTVQDECLADLLACAADARPGRCAVGDAIGPDDTERLGAIVQLFEAGAVQLHFGPAPLVLKSERPLASPLARFLVDARKEIVLTLDHRMIPFTEPTARAFLRLLDGRRDRTELDRLWQATGHAETMPFHEALAAVARAALLQR